MMYLHASVEKNQEFVLHSVAAKCIQFFLAVSQISLVSYKIRTKCVVRQKKSKNETY